MVTTMTTVGAALSSRLQILLSVRCRHGGLCVCASKFALLKHGGLEKGGKRADRARELSVALFLFLRDRQDLEEGSRFFY